MESKIVEVKRSQVNTPGKDPKLLFGSNELDNRLKHLNKYVTGILKNIKGKRETNQMPEIYLDHIDEHLKDISTTIDVLVQYQSYATDKANQMRKKDWKNQQFNSDFDYPIKVLKKHLNIV